MVINLITLDPTNNCAILNVRSSGLLLALSLFFSVCWITCKNKYGLVPNQIMPFSILKFIK